MGRWKILGTIGAFIILAIGIVWFVVAKNSLSAFKPSGKSDSILNLYGFTEKGLSQLIITAYVKGEFVPEKWNLDSQKEFIFSVKDADGRFSEPMTFCPGLTTVQQPNGGNEWVVSALNKIEKGDQVSVIVNRVVIPKGVKGCSISTIRILK